MKAIAATTYGGPEVLKLVDIAKPEVKDTEVLIRVYANGVSQADVAMRRAEGLLPRLILGLTKPKAEIAGTLFAGKIEAVGAKVTRFAVGDDVFGETSTEFGTNAEYLSLDQDATIMPIPQNMSYEEAAPLCDGAITVHNFLVNVANVKPGMKVLINGASGGLGTSAVQLAKALGAEVTAIARGQNHELVKSLGADHVIDYRSEDFTANGKQYDVIFDTPHKLRFSKVRRSLTPNGMYMTPMMSFGSILLNSITPKLGGRQARLSLTGMLPHDKLRAGLAEIIALVEAGKMWTVLDRRFDFEEIREAHAYVEKGGKRGNVVVTIDHGAELKQAAE